MWLIQRIRIWKYYIIQIYKNEYKKKNSNIQERISKIIKRNCIIYKIIKYILYLKFIIYLLVSKISEDNCKMIYNFLKKDIKNYNKKNVYIIEKQLNMYIWSAIIM